MIRTLLTVLFLLGSPFHAFAAETVRYDFINQGKLEGGQTVVYGDDGSVQVDFQFNDRGRGPKIREEFALDADGLLGATTITGNSYLGAKVNERYTRDAKGARWTNGVDDATRRDRVNAWYVSMHGTPEGYAAMARAALRRDDRTLPLLPSGELSVRKVKSIQVPVGEGRQNATLYAVHGLGLTPGALWMTDELRYIGFASSWSSMVLKGWDAAIPMLKAESEAFDQAYYRNLSKQATRPAPALLRVHNVRVLDVVAGSLGEPTEVWVKDGRFIAAPDKAGDGDDGSDVESIDARGAVMMPGLWDMHSHLFDDSAVMNIAGGVTSVRDLGNSKVELDDLVKRIGEGAMAGPNVYRAALLDAEGPFRAPTGLIAKTLEEALVKIDEVASQDYIQIKLYSSVPPEWVPTLVKRAHQQGLRVSGHIPAFMTAESAVRAGFDEIQHINMVFLNFLAGKTDDTRTPLRFTLVGDKAGALDLESQPVQDFVALLKEKQTVVDPTLGIFVSMFSHEKGQPNPSIASIADHFPLTVQRSQLSPEMDINDDNREAYRRSADALVRMTKLLYDHGIPLVAGTDDLAGFALHRELELYVEAGIPVADVLRIATVNAAKIVGAGDHKGQVKTGFDADWILIEGNPLEDIGASRKVLQVMKGDRLYDPGTIYRGLSIKPFTSARAASAVDPRR